MTASVTLSANAGVMIEYNGVKILSDFIHHDNVPTFSSVPEKLLREILSPGGDFSGAELMLVSHEHPDHFSRQFASEYMKNNRQTTAAAPLHFAEREIVFNGSGGRFKTFNTEVSFFKTPHEKQNVYADVKHYCYKVKTGGASFVFMNDTSIEEEYLEELFSERADIAFINFPWFTLKHGRRFLTEKLNAENIVIYHLPIPSEDEFGFNAATVKALPKVELDCKKIEIMSKPLDKVEFEL